jgi:uncharacterized UPF0146 family protein
LGPADHGSLEQAELVGELSRPPDLDQADRLDEVAVGGADRVDAELNRRGCDVEVVDVEGLERRLSWEIREQRLLRVG